MSRNASNVDSVQRAIGRVLDTLDRADARLDAHYGTQRKHNRRTYRNAALVTMSVPGDTASDRAPCAIPVWIRNLSEGGMAVVSQQPIIGPEVFVGLRMGGPTAWFRARVTRTREVMGFSEVGLAFIERLQEAPNLQRYDLAAPAQESTACETPVEAVLV